MPNTVSRGPNSWTVKSGPLSTTIPSGPPPPPFLVSPPRGTVAAFAASTPGSEIAPIGLNVNSGEYVISVPDGVSSPMGNYTGKSIDAVRKDVMERKKISNNYKAVMNKTAKVQSNYNEKLAIARNAVAARNNYKTIISNWGSKPSKLGVAEKLATRKNLVKVMTQQNKLRGTAINATRKRCGWKKGLLGWTKPKLGKNGKWLLPPGAKPEECTADALGL